MKEGMDTPESSSNTTKLTSSIFPSNMNESEKLSLQIKTLEQKLIERTSDVLKNTDMLKQFHSFKQDTVFRSNEQLGKKRSLRSARVKEVTEEDEQQLEFE
uniref:Uncharacterized protein n=1 Tax=Strombidium inclinatum TaxID=197538 RepID=A0A7S3ICA8_9SPIT|mmetsp:Transcript_10797/g.16413  ORF Transcript_10797/g.16413 Transcript_10797/m.16413 type:complete len:101 (+) Transcript_10797:108-410(+)